MKPKSERPLGRTSQTPNFSNGFGVWVWGGGLGHPNTLPCPALAAPVEEVPVGALLQVRAGEHVPLDGAVVAGVAAVDESAVTGESTPVVKRSGAGLGAAWAGGLGWQVLATPSSLPPASPSRSEGGHSLSALAQGGGAKQGGP